MDTGPILALEFLSTIMPGNYRHLQHPRALDIATWVVTFPRGREVQARKEWGRRHRGALRRPRLLLASARISTEVYATF
jgi:hypothetical protein